jgi:hypothetical protein
MSKKIQPGSDVSSNKNEESLAGIRIKNMKDQFLARRINKAKTNVKVKPVLSEESLKNVYKIASELLESVNKPGNSGEFRSETAEKLLHDAQMKQISKHDKDNEEDGEEDDELLDSEKQLEDLKFQILNGGSTTINYKKMLDYLAKCMQFEVNYQSLLGRDRSVLSYIRLNNLTDLPIEKPLNGQGLTFVESSNVAALNTLKYLASKNQ